jgi:hypothetical protein
MAKEERGKRKDSGSWRSKHKQRRPVPRWLPRSPHPWWTTPKKKSLSRQVTRASDDREKDRKAREQALQGKSSDKGGGQEAEGEAAVGGAKKSKSPGFTEGGTPKPSPWRKVAGLPSPPAVQSKSSKK